MKSTNLTKGILIGLAAGVAATAAKTIWEHYFPVRDEDTPPPPEILADEVSLKVTGEKVSKKNKGLITEAIHWAFGTLSGVLTTLISDRTKLASTAFGIPAGGAFWAATHGSIVPALGLEKPISDIKPEYARNEFLGHLVYGAVINLVQKGLVKAFK
jgi:putative membrane protein